MLPNTLWTDRSIAEQFTMGDRQIAKAMRAEYEAELDKLRTWIKAAIVELNTARDEAPTHARVRELNTLIDAAPVK